MSGGHVKNPVFMQLIADVCDMPVQLPFSSSASVVAGSAILGRFAAEVKDPQGAAASGEYAPQEGLKIADQKTAEESSFKYKDHLWDLMVRMTKPGTLVFPQKDAKLSALLDVKYKVSLADAALLPDLYIERNTDSICPCFARVPTNRSSENLSRSSESGSRWLPMSPTDLQFVQGCYSHDAMLLFFRSRTFSAGECCLYIANVYARSC